jgi:hypothetical protein
MGLHEIYQENSARAECLFFEALYILDILPPAFSVKKKKKNFTENSLKIPGRTPSSQRTGNSSIM